MDNPWDDENGTPAETTGGEAGAAVNPPAASTVGEDRPERLGVAASGHQAGQGPYRQGLTAEYLRAIISYAPDTGHFTWRISRSNVRAGERAGCSREDGYRLIRIDKTMYLEHRLAWLYVHGEWPSQFIDHINNN